MSSCGQQAWTEVRPYCLALTPQSPHPPQSPHLPSSEASWQPSDMPKAWAVAGTGHSFSETDPFPDDSPRGLWAAVCRPPVSPHLPQSLRQLPEKLGLCLGQLPPPSVPLSAQGGVTCDHAHPPASTDCLKAHGDYCHRNDGQVSLPSRGCQEGLPVLPSPPEVQGASVLRGHVWV